jgi:hypothetical protein
MNNLNSQNFVNYLNFTPSQPSPCTVLLDSGCTAQFLLANAKCSNKKIHYYAVGSAPTKWRHNHVNTYGNFKYALLATGSTTGTYPPSISSTLVTFSWAHV